MAAADMDAGRWDIVHQRIAAKSRPGRKGISFAAVLQERDRVHSALRDRTVSSSSRSPSVNLTAASVGTAATSAATTSLARYADPVGDRKLVTGGPRGCHGHRARPGPAGPRLPRSTLVDPHLDVAGPPSYDELDVHAVREGVLW